MLPHSLRRFRSFATTKMGSTRPNRPRVERLEDRLAPAADIVQLSWNNETAPVYADEWIVQFDDVQGMPAAQISQITSRLQSQPLPLEVQKHLGADGLVLVKAPQGASYQQIVSALSPLGKVEQLEPNFVLTAAMTPNDTRYGELYGLHNTGQIISGFSGIADADIDAPEAWDITQGNPSVVVGIIDSGIDYTHPDLVNNLFINPGEIPGNGLDDDGNGFIDDFRGWNFVAGTNNPMDDNSHGTHVAGTIAAAGNNNLGVIGVAPQVKVVALKFLDSGGFGSIANAISAVNYANGLRDRGVNIVMTNNSWGGGAYSTALEAAINGHRTRNMLFVAAAGNDNYNNDASPSYPASYSPDNVIAVAATDNRDGKASFSQWGLNSVDIAAPGVSTLSTVPGGGYGYKNGTSMASPHVAGVAALLYSANPWASYQQIRDAIFNGGDPNAAFAATGSTPVKTGKRLNAYGALQQMGLRVNSATPANGSVVTAPPFSFTLTTSTPLDPVTVHASDLTVNGLPATDVVYVPGSTTVTFTYAISPVTLEGVQTLQVAAGAFNRATDANAVAAFSSTFRYDVLVLQVVSTDPAVGSLITLPATTLDVNFNEPVSPATVSAGDLTLSQGSVSGYSLLNGNQTIRFTLAGVSAEGTLTVGIAAGALADINGNPNLVFTGNYSLDIGTVPFPTPFTARLPLGSLIYERTASVTIVPTADTDVFTLSLDALQTVAIVVDPSATLRPVIELRDPSNNLVASATGTAAGFDTLLQTAPLAVGGTYTITIGAAAGTTGTASVRVVLNAALEPESFGGPGNDSIAAAFDLEPSAVALGTGATRLAVLGSSPGTVFANETFESGILSPAFSPYSSNSFGRIQVTAPGGTGNASNFALRMDSNVDANYALNEAVYTVDLAGASGANLSFRYNGYNDEAEPLPATFSGHRNGDGVAISADGVNWATILSAPTAITWTTANIDLVAAATAAGMTLGPNFRIKFQQYDDFAYPTDGRSYDDILIQGSASPDFYRFTLGMGESATVALKSLTAGTTQISLLDSMGALLTHGAGGATNLDSRINNFISAAGGTYYLRIDGDTDYSLVVTKGADFDAEANDTNLAAQKIQSSPTAAVQRTLGYKEANGVDRYAVTLEAGATLQATTSTPGDAVGEFGNLLNPRVRLLNSSGVQVALDDDSAGDGRNASLSYVVPDGASGVYYLEVSSGVATQAGEYVLSVQGASPVPLPFQVAAATPADGALLTTSPANIVVDFNDLILTSSVQAGDLQIDGVSATGFTIVDGDSVRFTLPALSQGSHTFTITAGAVVDLQGTPVAAYSASFLLDSVGPRVVATSIVPGSIIAPGAVSYQVTFSEPMRVGNLTSDDFTLAGAARGVGYAASTFSYDVTGTVLTLDYANLPDDRYTLTLLAGASNGANFTDPAGNPIDGEFTGSFPSGNGTPGGNFVVAFDAELASESVGTFAARTPLGSLIHDASVTRTLGAAGDVDAFTVAVEAGQTLAVLLTPTTATLQMAVELRDPSNALVASATAGAVNQPVLLNPTGLTVAGTYTISVRDVGSAIGVYTVQTTLNAVSEFEGNGGGSNNTPATAQSLTPSQLALTTSQSAGSRFAAVGRTDQDFAGYAAAAVAPSFQDISTTGAVSTATGTLSTQTLGAAQLGTFAFPFYGTTYTNLSFSATGIISFGTPIFTFANTDFIASPTEAAIAVLWDTLQVDGTGSGVSGRWIYWQVVGTGANQQLVIQWNQVRSFFNATYFTMQAVLSQDGSIQLNYAADFPAVQATTATVGVKAPGGASAQRLVLDYNGVQPLGTLVGPGLSTRLTPLAPTPDYYALPANAGQSVSATVTGQTGAALQLDLVAPDGITVLASGAPGANVGKAIANFTIPATGNYTLRVRGDGLSAVPYSLVVAQDVALDAELNNTAAIPQDLGASQAILGHVHDSGATSPFDLTGPAVTGAYVLSGSKITLGFHTDGSYITGSSGTGIRYNGVEFVAVGGLYASFTVGYNLFRYTNNLAAGYTQITGITRQDVSFGAIKGMRIVGMAGPSVRVERVVLFNQGDDFVSVNTRLTNLSGSTVNNVSTMENLDADQEAAATSNDVVLEGKFVRATGTGSGLTIGLGSPDSRSVVSAEGLINLDPFAIINTPVDPNGAVADIAIAQAFNFGSLAAGAQVSAVTVMTLGASAAAAEATYASNAGGLVLNDVDWYAVTLSNTTSLTAETRTPANPVGLLDPILQIYDAAGTTLIATGSPTGDGRNESLSVTGLTDGASYRIRVAAANGSRGAYVLGVDAVGTAALSLQRNVPLADFTNADSVTWRLLFSEDVLGVDAADFAIVASAGVVTGAAVVSGSGKAYTVTVSGIAGDGSLGLNLLNDGSIRDQANDGLSAGLVGQVYVIDRVLPTVSSITRLTPTGAFTNAGAVTFRVSFNEDVVGVDAADFSSNFGTVGAVTQVSPQTYDIPVSSLAAVEGTLTLSLAAGATVADLATNALVALAPTGANESYTLDHVAPALASIERLTPTSPTANVGAVAFRVSFSEGVSGVDAGDFSASFGTVGTVTQISPSVYSVPVSGLTALSGTLSLGLAGTGIADFAANVVAPAAPTGANESFMLDHSAPRVSSIARLAPTSAVTNAGAVTFRVSFSEDVLNVDAADFSASFGTVGTVTPVSPSVYDVLVSGLAAADGALALSFSAGQNVADVASNLLANVTPTSGHEGYLLDHVAPTADIVDVAPDPRTTAVGAVAVNFSENVGGLEIADFTLTRNGSPVSLAGLSVSGSGASYSLDLTTKTGVAGNYVLTLAAASVQDAAGNSLAGAASDAWSFSHVLLPVDVNPAANVVAEGALAGTPVGLTAYSPGSVVYSLTDSAGGRFAIHPSTGVVTVQNGAAFNVDDAGSHDVTVEVNDGNGVASASFTIYISRVRIVDDGDAGFSTVGNWTVQTMQGYQGDLRYASAGTGSSIASYSIPVTPGLYRVAATWQPEKNRATNAPFTLFDGATQIGGSVLLNQELVPNDFADAGKNWELVGTMIPVTGNTLNVKLGNNANEFVIADAIRVEWVGALAAGPEILLTLAGAPVESGSALSFGNSPVGMPITRTFTIQNVGATNLSLIGPIVVPAGFSVAATFGSAMLVPGASTTFSVRMDAASVGSLGGQISFGTNDADEANYVIHITGAVVSVPTKQIANNTDEAFATTGSWVYFARQGFQGDISYAAAGTGSSTATWTFAVTPGLYKIAAAWAAEGNRASNAPFTVHDGSTPLGTTLLNQKLAPNDFTADGAGWENLSVTPYVVTGNTLSVTLSNLANGFVIADAIRVEKVGALILGPAAAVSLDGVSVAVGSNVAFGAAYVGAPVIKNFTLTNAGAQTLNLTGPIAVPAGFSVASTFAETSLAPGVSTMFALRLDALALATSSGTVSFPSNDPASPFTFTVSGTVQAPPSIPVQTVDNTDANFATSGAGWVAYAGQGLGGNLLFHKPGAGSSQATWTFFAEPGQYRVAVTYKQESNRATNAQYVVKDGETTIGSATVNQKLAPNDFTAAGVKWKYLPGTVSLAGNKLVVSLSDLANGYVIADGVRIERI